MAGELQHSDRPLRRILLRGLLYSAATAGAIVLGSAAASAEDGLTGALQDPTSAVQTVTGTAGSAAAQQTDVGTTTDSTSEPVTAPVQTTAEQATAPVEKTTAVADEATAPVQTATDQATAPVEKTAAPVEKATAPVEKTTAVADEATAPVTDTVDTVTAPVADTLDTVTAPVADTLDTVTAPVADLTDQVTTVTAPLTGTVGTITAPVTGTLDAITAPVSDTVGTIIAPAAQISGTVETVTPAETTTATIPCATCETATGSPMDAYTAEVPDAPTTAVYTLPLAGSLGHVPALAPKPSQVAPSESRSASSSGAIATDLLFDSASFAPAEWGALTATSTSTAAASKPAPASVPRPMAPSSTPFQGVVSALTSGSQGASGSVFLLLFALAAATVLLRNSGLCQLAPGYAATLSGRAALIQDRPG